MNIVSFFAGCGGLDLGFEQAGFNVVWANEFEPHCRATYIRNHPNTEFVLRDIVRLFQIPDNQVCHDIVYYRIPLNRKRF